MPTRLLVSDLNGVFVEKSLAYELSRQSAYSRDAERIFQLHRAGRIPDRELIIQISKYLEGISYETIHQGALAIKPRIRRLDFPGWNTVLLSMDYMENVERIADILGIPNFYGNRIIYENGAHSGKVKEPIIDSEQKKKIVKDLIEKLKADIVIGLDHVTNTPLMDVCDAVFMAPTTEQLERSLQQIKSDQNITS